MSLQSFYALFYKELLRFWKVSLQTILAPVITTLLYLMIFSHLLEEHVQIQNGAIGYTSFLIPGLVMMTILQNAFANSSSSLIQSKITGNIIFILLPPISYLEFCAAYVLAATARGLLVGSCVYLAVIWFVDLPIHQPFWLIVFALFGSAILGVLGLIAGIWADNFDQIASFQNFIIVPLTFLSGVFYSIHSLSPFWQRLSQFNPFFYMTDGFRYGFFGVSDVSPFISFGVMTICFLSLAVLALYLLKTGYKLRR
jgi:ABC-2 type transport system permease protein